VLHARGVSKRENNLQHLNPIRAPVLWGRIKEFRRKTRIRDEIIFVVIQISLPAFSIPQENPI
jgi:hypothetical protein